MFIELLDVCIHNEIFSREEKSQLFNWKCDCQNVLKQATSSRGPIMDRWSLPVDFGRMRAETVPNRSAKPTSPGSSANTLLMNSATKQRRRQGEGPCFPFPCLCSQIPNSPLLFFFFFFSLHSFHSPLSLFFPEKQLVDSTLA